MFQDTAGIFRKRSQFVNLVRHVKAKEGEHLVFIDCALLVYAAASERPSPSRAEFYGKSVYVFCKSLSVPQVHESRHQLVADNHHIVGKGHISSAIVSGLSCKDKS